MEDCAVAVVTDNLAYESSYQAFETPPESSVLYSYIPRGIRRFFFSNDVQAKPVNDQINVFLTATLPVNFAYIMRSLNLRLSADTASDWENTVPLRMFNHIPGQQVGTAEWIASELSLYVPATANPTLYLNQHRLGISSFASPMWSVHGGGITFRVELTNVAAAAGAVAFLTSHCEFYEFDLTQAQRYFVNTPTPVLPR